MVFRKPLSAGYKSAVQLEVEITSATGSRNAGVGENAPLAKVEKLICYPNPTNKSLQIHFPSSVSGAGMLTIYDTRGQLLKSTSLEIIEGVNSFEMKDLDTLPSGILSLTLRTPINTFISRIVKL